MDGLKMNPQMWIDNGVAVIPIKYRSKRPVFAWRRYQKELPTKQNISTWFKSKFINTAVITGWRGLTIIDFDEWSIWQLWRDWITAKYSNLLDSTYRVKTSRGMHVYFFITDAPKRTLRLPKIDVKAAGGYCLVPNSIHPNGHVYRANMQDLKIITIDHLSDVMPRMLLQQAKKEVVIPECTHTQIQGEIDVWNITPQQVNGSGSINWVKRNRSILEFFPNARPTGDNYYMVRCPLHSDHKESASINVATNRIKCFKNCFGDRGVDLIDFYCLMKKCDRKQAIGDLSK